MSKPLLLVVDDDPQVLRAVSRDLRSQYKENYRIISTESAMEALESLKDLKNQGETVALFLSDNRMPEMQGVDFLEKAKEIFPTAKRVLLTAYSDTEAAIKAINDVQLDFYLLKPWDPPEEKLFPVLSDLLDEWEKTFVPDFKGLKVLGYQFSPKSHHIKDFLSGNLFPFKWMDVQQHGEAQELLQLNEIDPKQLPAVFFEDGSFLLQPTLEQLAEALGLRLQAEEALYDTIIIGAGPSGLAAAVYAASEGLKTLLIDKRAPGGQAGTSSRIENYLGFPKGLSGADLTRRAITQATRFGTEFLSPQEVIGLESSLPYKKVLLKSGAAIHSKTVVITTGVNYRQLQIPGMEKLLGAGVYYGAASTEASLCKDQRVMIIGGGNSAGQAAMYLSQFAREVIILVRGVGLEASMSSYLIDQIKSTESIRLWTKGEVVQVEGDEHLEKVHVQFKDKDEREQVDITALFVFIGAQPITHWLPESILKDGKNFILTGMALKQDPQFKKHWKLQRDPYLLESSVPGVFSAGDVRSGAMNRVASAVGEGAMSISMVHKYLEEI